MKEHRQENWHWDNLVGGDLRESMVQKRKVSMDKRKGEESFGGDDKGKNQ